MGQEAPAKMQVRILEAENILTDVALYIYVNIKIVHIIKVLNCGKHSRWI